jgi:hypothetical protein
VPDESSYVCTLNSGLTMTHCVRHGSKALPILPAGTLPKTGSPPVFWNLWYL